MNFERAEFKKEKTPDFVGLQSERALAPEQEKKIDQLLSFGRQNGNEMSVLKPGLQLKGLRPETEAEELLQQFIASPMIKDTFDLDNTSRREWEQKYLFPQGGELLETYRLNKLSKARSMNVVGNFPLIYELEQDFTPELAEEINLLIEKLSDSPDISDVESEAGDPYDHFSLEEKVKFMDRYELAALEILTAINKSRGN